MYVVFESERLILKHSLQLLCVLTVKRKLSTLVFDQSPHYISCAAAITASRSLKNDASFVHLLHLFLLSFKFTCVSLLVVRVYAIERKSERERERPKT